MAIECKYCPQGFHAFDAKKTECNACAPGKYQTEFGQATCQMCVPGRTGHASEMIYECDLCSPGRFMPDSNSNASECLPCNPGEYQDKEGQTSCFMCVPGFFNDMTNASVECKACPRGWFSKFSGGSSCYKPAAGSIVAEGGASIVAVAVGWHPTDCDEFNVCLKSEPCPAGTQGLPNRTCVA